MPFSEAQQASNLTFFVGDFLQPTAEPVIAAEYLPINTKGCVSFALLEAFLWLHLGVRIDYFSKSRSRRIMFEYSHLVLKAYETVIGQNHQQKFPRPLQQLLDAELNGRTELFSTGEKIVLSSDMVSQFFQTALMLAGGFTLNQTAQQLLKMLIFASTPGWNDAVGGQKPAMYQADDEIETDLVGPADYWAFPGFFAVLRYMESFRQVVEDLEQDTDGRPAQEMDQYFALKRDIKALQTWRLNFEDKIVLERFLQLARSAAESLTRDLPQIQLPRSVSTKSLVGAATDLMMDWGAPALKEGAESDGSV